MACMITEYCIKHGDYSVDLNGLDWRCPKCCAEIKAEKIYNSLANISWFTIKD